MIRLACSAVSVDSAEPVEACPCPSAIPHRERVDLVAQEPVVLAELVALAAALVVPAVQAVAVMKIGGMYLSEAVIMVQT
jgi:hypothetical protein